MEQGATPPVETDFTDGQGSYLTDEHTNTRFTEWKHYKNPCATTASDPLKFTVKFKKGIIVKFDGTNSPAVDNGLNYSVVNASDTTRNVDVNIRVWFTHE